MPSSQKGFAPIVVILVLVLLVGGLLTFKFLNPEVNQQTNPSLSPSPKAVIKECSIIEPTTKPSSKSGWTNLTGRAYDATCQTYFSIDYPSNWERDDYLLYPFGKTKKLNEQQTDAVINLRAGGHGWYSDLKIETRNFPSGSGRYSWGKPSSEDYVVGFADMSSNDNKGMLIEAANIPPQKSEEIQLIFNQMLNSLKFINNTTPDSIDNIFIKENSITPSSDKPNWKKYTNTGKYTVEVPNEWSISESETLGSASVFIRPPDTKFVIRIDKSSNPTTIKEYFAYEGPYKQGKEILIDNYPFYYYSAEDHYPWVAGTVTGYVISIRASEGGRELEINPSNKKYLDTFNEIISTIKLTQ